MKEELINKILERTDIFAKEKLEELDEVVLERLCLIDNTYDLEDIILVLFNLKSDVSLSIAYINVYDLHLLGKGKYDDYINQLLLSNIDLALKAEALNKMMLAKYDFQIEYIKHIYVNLEIKNKDMLVDIILKCSKDTQVEAIYDIFDLKEYGEEYMAQYLELAKLIAKETTEYKIPFYRILTINENILKLGLLVPTANLISKCKTCSQVRNIDSFLKNLDNNNAPLILKYCEYFLRTTDEDKLESLYKYFTFCLNQSLLVEEEKVNLIINARNKYNSNAIGNTLTYGPLIDANLDVVAAEILNDSRKEYNVKYAKSLVNIGSVSGLSGAMIVNESETKYKAEQVHSLISLYANTDEIDGSLEFASLINSVHTKTEIDLIYLLGHNGYLNKLGIALPIARVIADATDCEEDIEKIKECLRDEENIVKAIKGFIYLIKCIDLNDRQKAENIINRVLLRTQNRPIHIDFIEEKEPTLNNIKIPAPIRTLSDKTNKKY